ncbi:MAG: 5'-nucleotidase C-terminal domain-containing protein [Bacillota bacterium]|nr:5'-nucleotidase C-terminal domain-containing protein [Bacillota bacterium]
MKTTKKVLSLLLVLAMIFTLAIPALAVDTTTETLVSWVNGESLVSNGQNDVLSDVTLAYSGKAADLKTGASYGNLTAQNWLGVNNFVNGAAFYLSFAISTKGYENLSVETVLGGNARIPTTYKVQYSLDNETFVDADGVINAAAGKNKVADAAVSSIAIPAEAADQEMVYFRITQTVAAAPNDKGNGTDAGALYIFSLAVEGDPTETPIVPPADELDGKTVILHTNDIHGAIEGYATIAALKAEFEAKGANVILADAGDFSQGTTYVSTSKGADAVAMMNAAGYDVATLGNHEFDYGWEQLKTNMSAADFKVLCADVFENGESIFDGHTIIEKDGVKIGFFGMETPEAQTKTNPALIKGLTFLAGEEMCACAQAQVDALKAEGADVIICLSHLGLDNESMPNRSVDMLAKVNGIDMIIDGHSHTVITANAEQPIQSTGTAFANIGVIVVDNATKAIVDNYLVPVTDESAKDEAVAAAAKAIIDAINEQYGQVFAKSEVDLNGDKAPGNRNMETNLGDLITDSMVWQVMQNKDGLTVDDDHIVAITNGGGIRAWIHQGDITMNDVHTVLPFGNTIAVVYVTGAELLEALEASTYCTPGAVGGFPQVAGIDFTIATYKDYDANAETYPASTYYGPASINRVTINSINGKDFDPEATYAVITNNFCAAGGDTYYAFAAASAQFDTGVPLDEALMAYITEELGGVIGQQYAEPQGRITIETEAPAGELDGKTVILHTNDIHGAIEGYATIAALKAEFEAKGANVILADAGDFSQGTTYVSTSKGADAVAMMNAAGYDVATLGNHEFDYGWEQLKTNMSAADFKVLCADVFENGESIFDGHTIIEKDGVKIGFFGMETPEAQTKTNPALIKGLTFLAGEEMCACAQAQVDALKAEGADVIICLSHLGLDNESMPNRSVDMLAKVNGIDMIIDGHSHTVITANAEQPIQSTGTAFANIGVIVVDNATKAIVDNYLVPVTDESAKDEAVAAAAKAIIDAINEQYGQVFAKSEVDLNGDKAPGNRNMETNLGDLITDSMVWQVMQNKDGLTVDDDHIVAITNGGGIRAWIHQGDITMNDVHTVLPFGNTIAVVYVTGAELLEALEASTYCTPGAVGGFPQVAGIDFTIATYKDYDANAETYPASTYYGPASINRVTINSINGKDFDPEATYAVITNNFCAAGGDTYYAFAAASAQFDTGVPLDEALMAYITEELGGVIGQQYAAPQGRITVSEHSWSDWGVVVPGCVEGGGFEARVCNICGSFETRDVEETPGDHSNDPFSDISASGYHDYIIIANFWQIAGGYPGGTFHPNDNVTRAQFITMLWRLAGRPDATNTTLSFADAGMISAPYQAAVAWGVENGIIQGYGDGTFRPNANISRAQMATFMYRFIAGEKGPADAAARASYGFVDEGSIAASYVDAVNVIANLGIMNGVDTAPTFNANGTANRGMAATVLVRLYTYMYVDEAA